MTRILVLSDDGVASGFGRIAMHLNAALHRRGHQIMAASLQYDGLLPPQYEGRSLPYWVAALAGKNWLEETVKLIGVYDPDLVLVIQDAPYAHHLRHAPVDWSRHAFAMITPVDGAPLFPDWAATARLADAVLTLSEFGVAAFRQAGVTAGLCRPGVDLDVFYPLPPDEKAALRERMGIAPQAFVLMSACMNQGRKAIPAMLEGFFAFAADKPDARYLLDMDAVSPAGWNIPVLCQQFGWDARRLIFRADAARAGLTHLRQRFNLADAHAVLAHREGFGLPLQESQACGVATLALDYCSGPEICGEGHGVLIPALPYRSISTWGGARDCHADPAAFAAALQRLHDHPDERRAIALKGMQRARTRTWDAAVDAAANAIDAAMRRRQNGNGREMAAG